MEKGSIARFFLLFLIILVLYACYLIFRPFLAEILVAAILVSIFYTPYEWLTKKLRGRKTLSSFIMCLLILALVIVPLANFIVYAAQESVEAYVQFSRYVNANDLNSTIVQNQIWNRVDFIGIDADSLRGFVVDITKKLSDWLVSGGANLLRGTTNFIISLLLIIFTMFFFFIDGPWMLERIMHWTPLPNKYDKRIFDKFRKVSYSVVVSSFLTALVQGFVGALGFLIVGLPAFFAGVAMAFLSLLPYIGTALIWLPVGAYLLLAGKIWQGVFILIWGALIVSNIDNILKAYLMKGKARVHPIFIIFSILGGIALFGFWGIFFGPLIISLAVTILHIYELEYGSVLEK